MNSSEKNVLRLALCLFVLGILVRVLPWGLPSIESIQLESEDPVIEITDKVTEFVADSGKVTPEKSQKSPKKEKKHKKKVVLPLGINTASADDLCALNGVGPKLAEKIVAFREASGPFKTPKDLEKVPGIGKKKLESILPGVIFD